MSLSSDLISQFVKVTKDDKEVKKETTVYGTVVYDGRPYVKLDGSDLLTPVSTTANVKDGERVTVMIKDHTATVTGNISSPSASTNDVKEEVASQVSEFEIVVAHKVTTDDLQATNAIIDNLIAVTGKYSELEAITAEFESLRAEFIEGETLTVEDIEAITAKIESIESEFGEFTDISTEDLDAINAEITHLKGYTADFTYISAVNADVKQLNAGKADIDFANITTAAIKNLGATFANIDFANIGEAAIRKIFSETGLIKDLIVGDQTITGELVGVTIIGDYIKGGTVTADKLVVKGSDGLYYKLNIEAGSFSSAEEVPTDSLHGSIITAKSITAEKVSVKDLVAFGATIGGFNITDRSLYSGVKSTIDNATRGIYIDNNGQLSLGDGSHYLRYYQILYIESAFISGDGVLIVTAKENTGYFVDVLADQLVAKITDGIAPAPAVSIQNDVLIVNDSGSYKLDISADSIVFGADSKSSLSDLLPLTERIRMGNIIDEETGDEKPCIELSEGDSEFKQVITNVKTMFVDGATVKTEIDSDGVSTENVSVRGEFRHGNFVWATRANGNYGLSWKGATS